MRAMLLAVLVAAVGCGDDGAPGTVTGNYDYVATLEGGQGSLRGTLSLQEQAGEVEGFFDLDYLDGSGRKVRDLGGGVDDGRTASGGNVSFELQDWPFFIDHNGTLRGNQIAGSAVMRNSDNNGSLSATFTATRK